MSIQHTDKQSTVHFKTFWGAWVYFKAVAQIQTSLRLMVHFDHPIHFLTAAGGGFRKSQFGPPVTSHAHTENGHEFNRSDITANVHFRDMLQCERRLCPG